MPVPLLEQRPLKASWSSVVGVCLDLLICSHAPSWRHSRQWQHGRLLMYHTVCGAAVIFHCALTGLPGGFYRSEYYHSWFPQWHRWHQCSKRWQLTEKSDFMWLMISRILSLPSWGVYRALNLWQWSLCPQITITHLRASTQPDSTHQSSLIFCQRFTYWGNVCRCVCVRVHCAYIRLSRACFLRKMERAQSIKHLTIEDLPL